MGESAVVLNDIHLVPQPLGQVGRLSEDGGGDIVMAGLPGGCHRP